MTGREDRIYQEAVALWREFHGETPPDAMDGSMILDLITRELPAEDYRRLSSPYMRPAAVSFPKN